MNKEQVKEELRLIILDYLRSKCIDPNDKTRLFMESHGIWDAMVRSGRLPRALTYDMMLKSIIKSMIGEN